jgi:signal transduction histidine kinase
VSFVHRRHFVTFVALAGLFVTWGVMMAFSWSQKAGIITFAPWVALAGFDLGLLGGIAGAALATGLFLLASDVDNVDIDGLQIGVRAGSLGALVIGTALAGRRLRASVHAQRNVASLQSALIDSTLDGVCLTDERGEILISNRPLRRLSVELGLPGEGTVQSRLIAISQTMVDPERYRQRMVEVGNAPGESTIDEFEVAATGRCFRGYTSPVRDVDGSFAGRIWTLREVTADRELDRMRDAFVATVSHELRTPLTSISGFLEMMQDEEEGLGETGRQYLEVIRRSTERLHALVEDLLLIAQIEAKRVELQREPIDLRELVASAVETVQSAADAKGVTLDVVTDHPLEVSADRGRIGQALDSLLSNAVKFTNEGGSVTITVAGDHDSVQLVVADTGIGVAADEQAQIFSRFFRATTATKRAIPGTGLGLAISQALVEQHGGTISFASREGEGTQVTITLPADA